MSKMEKNKIINITLTSVAFIITLICVMTGNFISDKYDISVGNVSPKRFVATRDVVNTFATDKKKEEAMKSVSDIYKHDSEVTAKVLKKINVFFSDIDLKIDEKTPSQIQSNEQGDNTTTTENTENNFYKNLFPGLQKSDSADNTETGTENNNSNSIDNDSTNQNNIDKTNNDMDSNKIPSEIDEEAIKSADSNIFDNLKLNPTESENANTDNDKSAEISNETVASPISVSDGQISYYEGLNKSIQREFETEIFAITSSVMQQEITDKNDSKILAFIRGEIDKKNWDEQLKTLGYTVVSSAIEQNSIIDVEATEAAREKKAEEVEDIIVSQNEKIVDVNERVTEEAYEILVSLNMVKNGGGINLFPLIGSIALVTLLFSCLIIYINLFNKNLLRIKRKKLILLFILYILSIVVFRLSVSLPFYIIPMTIIPMLTAILIEQRLAVVFNVVITLIGLMIYKGDLSFLIYFVVTGTLAALFTKLTYERNKIVFVGFILGIVNLITILAVGFFYEQGISGDLFYHCILGVANGMLSLIITMGSLPIWEAIFDIITPTKLLDLTNPNSALLRRLTIEAPGTYHHSLIVANLAEAAAIEVDANPTLTRVGAYYHDIGKLKHPHLFSENQSGSNSHDTMDPYASATALMEHTSYGLELAETYRLPKAIKDIIVQHHGTTLVKFFYHKAVTAYSEEFVKKDDFTYKGIIPQTKEAAIVMLADICEAAVRSMVSGSKSQDEIDTFMKKLIKEKLDEGQMDQSQLTIKELDDIRKSFMKVFKGMYHERVKYPDQLKNEAETAVAAAAVGLVSATSIVSIEKGKLDKNAGKKRLNGFNHTIQDTIKSRELINIKNEENDE